MSGRPLAEPSPQRAGEVDDDERVDDDPAGLPDARVDGELVQLERNQERRRDDGQVLCPETIAPQTDTLDKLENAVGERSDAGDAQLMRAQAVQAVDQPAKEVLARIDVDAPDDALVH